MDFSTPKPIRNPLAPDYEIGKIISGALGLIMIFAAIICFIFLVTGGMSWITSGGDKAAVETARNRIMNAIIGLILILSVWAIINLLFPMLGLSFPAIQLPGIGRGLENIP